MYIPKLFYLCPAFACLCMLRRAKPERYGGMAEWSNAAVLKTVEGHTSGGSNPSSSAKKNPDSDVWVFFIPVASKACFCKQEGIK